MTVKGYKVFNPDFTCNRFQYKEGEIFEHSGKLEICDSGFHFCKVASDCFSYYSFDPKNIVCEVEALGEIIEHDSDSKVVTNKIRIVRKLSWQEVLAAANSGANNTGYRNSGNRNSGDSNSGNWNSGNWNSGYRNSGDRNSGNWNSGNWNSGNRNSGDSNSGNWNSGYRNSGYRNSGDSNSGNWNSGVFCSDENPPIRLFDKPCNMKVKEWEQSEARNLMWNVRLTEWVDKIDMTKAEKEANKNYEIVGGYLKTKTMHEAWADAWAKFTKKERQVFLDLPNFDAKKFKEITGVEV